MKDRQINILNNLINSPNQYHSINNLKQMVGCSEKTVRNDLNEIEALLTNETEITLIRKRGKGISLKGKHDAMSALYLALNQIPKVGEDEKLIEIAYYLLTTSKAVTLQYFADKYYVHLGIIKEDIEIINQWLTRFKLNIISVQSKGTYIQGNEFNKRNALAHLSELMGDSKENVKVIDFFEPSEVHIVRSAIWHTQQHFNLIWNSGSFDSLVIHTLIMIKRTRQKNKIFLSDDTKIYSTEYQVTNYLLNYIRQKININFPEEEIIYLSWHVTSSIKNKADKNEHSYYITQKTNVITEQLMEKVEYLTQIPFKQEDTLKESIRVHMEAVIKRLEYGFHISNPMLHEIKKLYPYMLSMVVFALNEIAEENDYSIPEEEAAFLVLHFQATLEKMGNKQKNKNVLVICHMGIGMSRLLEAKLKQQYERLTIVDCISEQKFYQIIKQLESVDFIISTIPLKNTFIPHIVISPLLNNDDKKILNQFIQEKERTAFPTNYHTLKDLIKDGLFQTNISLAHPFEVVERLANQLVRLDFVEPQFTHHILIRERSSYTAIGGKIAIPHAEPSTVRETKLSIGILKEAIEWGMEQVSIVFMLAVNEEDRYLTRDLLKEIAILSEDPEKVEQIIKCKHREELLDVLA